MNLRSSVISAAMFLPVTLLFTGCARETAPLLSYSDTTPVAMRSTLEEGLAAGGGGVAATLGDPTGWATLRGKFTVQGSPPSRSALSITKDPEVCAPGGIQVLDESVMVGPSGGIQNVLVFVSSKLPQDDPRWEHADYADSKYSEVEFDQKACIFLSHVKAFRATQKVRVLNSDPVGHNTNIDSKRGAASANFTVPANSSAIYEPGAASPAPYGVVCSIHPWMSAWMMSCDNPYFAVTDAEGNFEIKNLPAGVELEFRVWQESSKFSFAQQVSVNGQAAKWSKGKFKMALAAEEEHELSVVVDGSAF